MTNTPRVRPSGGYYALRHDKSQPGDYDATPVVSWADNGDGTATPLTVIQINHTAVQCPDGSVIDLANGLLHADISDWLVYSQRGGSAGKKAAPMVAASNTPTLRDLGISGRACAPLERLGIKRLGDLQTVTMEEVAAVKGVSTDTLSELVALMTRKGLAWKGEDVVNGEDTMNESVGPDDDDDEVEDVL